MPRTGESYNDYMKQYMQTRRESRRRMLRERLGGVCIQCGAAEELEFDHIDPALKSFTISEPGALDGPLARLLAEADKCQLLCRPCHIERTREQQSAITHGTHWCYVKYGCRCDDCKAAYTAKNREYKQNYLRKKSNPA